MRKSDKKIDNQIRTILTELCNDYYEGVNGFKWLTHVVNYSTIANSLRVICVFDSQEHIDQFLVSGSTVNVTANSMLLELNKRLNTIGIKVKKLDKLIQYDSEISCSQEHNGNWAKRLIAIY